MIIHFYKTFPGFPNRILSTSRESPYPRLEEKKTQRERKFNERRKRERENTHTKRKQRYLVNFNETKQFFAIFEKSNIKDIAGL